MLSSWVGLPQVGGTAVSECVALRLPLPGVVVTCFVTGSGFLPKNFGSPRSRWLRQISLALPAAPGLAATRAAAEMRLRSAAITVTTGVRLWVSSGLAGLVFEAAGTPIGAVG